MSITGLHEAVRGFLRSGWRRVGRIFPRRRLNQLSEFWATVGTWSLGVTVQLESVLMGVWQLAEMLFELL